jgi:hypothetical protein
MIKVEIKPVYGCSCASYAKEEFEYPEYLKKTIKILGLTIYVGIVRPIKYKDSIEWNFRT